MLGLVVSLLGPNESFLLLLFLYLCFACRSKPRLPPGPTGYPLIGITIRELTTRPFETLSRWRTEFGYLVYAKILGKRVVFVNGFHTADDLFNKQRVIFCERPPRVMAHLSGYHNALIFMPYGDRHKHTRRQMHEGLNAHVVHQYHSLVEDSIFRFLGEMLHGQGELGQRIRFYYIRTLLVLMVGYEATSEEDPMVVSSEKVGENSVAMVVSINSKFWIEAFPLARYLPTWATGPSLARIINTFTEDLKRVLSLTESFVRQNIQIPAVASSFLAKLLDSASSEEEATLAKFTSVSLYGGATDTLTSSSKTFFMAMVLYPEVQRKAQEEIDGLLGRKRLPTLADRASMPYTEALVTELLRWAPPVPLTSRFVKQEIKYAKYMIPARTTFVANIWAMAHDPECFKNPESFVPERFYNSDDGRDVKFLEESKKQIRHIVFGFGGRVCPGRFLADDWLWLFVASVVATIHVSAPHGVTVEHPKLELSGILQPPPFPFELKARFAGAEDIIAASMQ